MGVKPEGEMQKKSLCKGDMPIKSDFKVVTDNSKLKVEPNEPTTTVECPMCSKQYTLLSDLGDHMTKFHRIPLNIQRKLLKGRKSLAIIQEDL